MMNLFLNLELATRYKSPAQIARVLTENWLGENVYCPSCGNKPMEKAANNSPVQDFVCTQCSEQYELKSQNAVSLGKKINDGAYQMMMERIQSDTNPNFFFLSYKKADYSIQQLVLVPKHFMTADMIIRRKPLPETARRAGWIGCVIDVSKLPERGKILMVDRARIIEPKHVLQQWQEGLFLRQNPIKQKGWLLAVMKCIECLPEKFGLDEVYRFETELAVRFPENRHIKEKIRQQLQVLRDLGMIEFVSRGRYRKTARGNRF